MGRESSRCACRIMLFAVCRLAMVGFAVSLADHETFAARPMRVFGTNRWSEAFIPRNVLSPATPTLFSHLVCAGFGVCGNQQMRVA